MKLMKNVKMPCILTVLLLLLVSSCTQDPSLEAIQNNLSELKKDPILIELMEQTIDQVDQIVDFETLKEMSQKTSLSPQETTALIVAMGYRNVDEHTLAQKKYRKLAQNLNARYHLDHIDRSTFISIAQEAEYPKLTLPTDKNIGCNCFRIARNCIIETGAAAVIGHIACASLDIAIIPGLLCHAAVLVLQVAATDNCNANRDNCLVNCYT